ncbi:MAG: group III truncated hemoglobin [Acidobacteria bacterium]|nr:group III truncated hemoglobin [Acidobacteriota bacterium]
MRDIETRTDIDLVMRVFYERALADEVVGYIFRDVAKLDLEHHLPIIGDFWEAILFRTGDYQLRGRNPMEVHRQLHLRSAFKSDHFSRWLELFVKSVDDEFAGPRAEFIKFRARSIASRFQVNLGILSEGSTNPEEIAVEA